MYVSTQGVTLEISTTLKIRFKFFPLIEGKLLFIERRGAAELGGSTCPRGPVFSAEPNFDVLNR